MADPQKPDGPKRILIVDDEPEVVGVLCDFLRRQYVVESALNGPDGLAAILRQRPDIVLLDYNMPGLNGLEVLKQIQKIDPRIRVIMVTGTQDARVAAEVLGAGAFAYIPKPFDWRYIDALVGAAAS